MVSRCGWDGLGDACELPGAVYCDEECVGTGMGCTSSDCDFYANVLATDVSATHTQHARTTASLLNAAASAQAYAGRWHEGTSSAQSADHFNAAAATLGNDILQL